MRIQLLNVRKQFQGRSNVMALKDIKLSINSGERVAIVGPSGCGKSTLLAVMGTLERPSAGSLQFDGRDISTVSDRALARMRARSIGFVFQEFYLLDRLTALENVSEALCYADVRPPERDRRARAILAQLGLAPRLDHYPHQLSGGERQRVAIARALAKHPTLLLADEPTGNLDPATGAEVVDMMLDAAENATVVIVTHNPEVAQKLGRVITLEAGSLASDFRDDS